MKTRIHDAPDTLMVAYNGSFRLMFRVDAKRKEDFRRTAERLSWEVSELHPSGPVVKDVLPATRALATAMA